MDSVDRLAPYARRGTRPRFYFSLRSPYSWLAYRELVGRYADVADQLEWVPFWEPDEDSTRLLTTSGGRFVYSPMSREKHLYILQDVRRLAAAQGLAVAWPVDRLPHWEVPHLAYLVALSEGVGREFIDVAYRARWQEGRDICDREVVADLAAGLGLDPVRMSGAADDERLRQLGVSALTAIHRDGVFGVPFFVHKYDKYWGFDRLPAFVAEIRTQFIAVGAVPELPGDTTEWGHAGGCG